MDSRESFENRRYDADSHFEVFSRVEASFDKAWVESIGTDLCRILEEIEKLGVEITFKKGQHILCGTLKQLQYVQDHVCHGPRFGGPHDSREVGRPFESLPAQYYSSSQEYRPEHESSFSNRSLRYDVGQPPRGGYTSQAGDERGATWNNPTERASYPSMQLSKREPGYGGQWKMPVEVEHCGNVPSDYTEKVPKSFDERNVYKSNRDAQLRENASDRGGRDTCKESEKVEEGSGMQTRSGTNDEMQVKRAEEKKRLGNEDQRGEVADEGIFQELMVDRDIWEYIEVKMSQQWMSIQEFGAKIDKIVEESGMVRLRITPMSSEDDSDAVGLVYDSLAGLYNEVQGSIIMEVLHLTPPPSNEAIATTVLQFINSQYPSVHVKTCAQRDHYYFVGPVHEVYLAFKMFQIAIRIAMENEIIRIGQLRERIEEMQREAEKNAANRASLGASARQAGVGSDLDTTAGAVYVPRDDRYEGMAVGNVVYQSRWKSYEGDAYGEDHYDPNEYDAGRSRRHRNGESVWSYPSNTGSAGGARAGGAGDLGEGFGEDFLAERRKIDTQADEFVSGRKYENSEFHTKKGDYGSDGDAGKADDSSRWGSIRMKADSVHATGRNVSLDSTYGKFDQEWEKVDRIRDVQSMSRLEISQANDESNPRELFAKYSEKSEKVKQFSGSENNNDDITTAPAEIRDIDSSDTEQEEEDEKVTGCTNSKLQSDTSNTAPSKVVESCNSLD